MAYSKTEDGNSVAVPCYKVKKRGLNYKNALLRSIIF